MRTNGLSIAGIASWLPHTSEPVAEAIRTGRYGADEAARSGITGLPVAELSAPEMAVLAGRKALDRTSPSEVDLLVHAWTYYQGHDFWSVAHYVADQLGAHRAVPVGVQQMCNGGMAGLELAAARLLADPAATTALVTTADAFRSEGFDRWRGDYGVCYGDGATALLLTTGPAEYALESVVSVPAASMEAIQRGHDPFAPAPRWSHERIDQRPAKKAFLEAGWLASFTADADRSIRDAVRRALAHADVKADAVRLVGLPRVGSDVLDLVYRPAVSELDGARIVDHGRGTGHLGAGDSAADLAEIVRADALGAGEYAVLVSAGAGFTFTAAVVHRRHTR